MEHPQVLAQKFAARRLGDHVQDLHLTQLLVGDLAATSVEIEEEGIGSSVLAHLVILDKLLDALDDARHGRGILGNLCDRIGG